MTNVLILGANGNIAKRLYHILKNEPDIKLFQTSKHAADGVLKLDAQNVKAINDFLTSHSIDIVYVNIDDPKMATLMTNIVTAMSHHHVSRLIWLTQIGLYGTDVPQGQEAMWQKLLGSPDDPTTFIGDLAQAAKVIENSHLNATIIRSTDLIDDNRMQALNIQEDRNAIIGQEVTRISLVEFIAQIVRDPSRYSHQSIALSSK